MMKKVSGLSTDRYPPERPKFKAPLLLVHGLWTGSWCWKTWATHFCNLGWDCWAVNFPGRAAKGDDRVLPELNPERCVADLARVIRSFSSPPVVVAHDTGALVALKVAEETSLAALVLASPPQPGNAKTRKPRVLRLLRLKYLMLIYLGRPFRIDEKDLQKIILAPLSESVRAQISRQIVSESSQMIAELFGSRVEIDPNRLPCPCLVLYGAQDPITPPASAHELAHWLSADFKEYRDQGHWLIEYDGKTIVRDIHRWIIQKLGEKVLLADFS